MMKTNPANWISQHFTTNESGEFMVGGVLVQQIANDLNAPFYVYDYETIRDQYQILTSALDQHGIGIYYSVKANTNITVLKSLYDLGAGLEIASIGELLAAKKIEADPKKLSYAGPVKTEVELRAAIAYGIGTINVESHDEFDRIDRIASESGIRQRVGIRVNSLHEVAGAGGRMAGGSKKFGFDEELLNAEFFESIAQYKNIELVGLHVFAATQIVSSDAFLANIEYVCSIAKNLQQYISLEYIDFGGGLGIPYSKDQSKLPLDEISDQMGSVLQKFDFIQQNNIKLFIEPGRFLVGPCGVYVAKVDNVKNSRGSEILLIDGGIHHMMRPVLAVGSSSHPVYNLSSITQPHSSPVGIGGSLCTSLDFVGVDIPFPKSKTGDLIGVFNAGAYGWSEAMTFFLSHPTAAEIMVKDQKYYVIRESIHPEEFLRNQYVVT